MSSRKLLVLGAGAAAIAAAALVRRFTRARHPQVASKLDTPALLLDLDALDFNIEAISSFCARHGLLWRPHCKAIRSADVAMRMIRAGACGVTCAKVSQAAALAAGGVRDILIANEVVGEIKVAALVRLARCAVVCVAVDDEANLRAISRAAVLAGVSIAVLVDVDAGMGRCGVPHGDTPTLVALSRLASSLPGITFRGLMGYDGHTQSGNAAAREDATCFAENLRAATAAVEAAGVAVGLVSGGGSGNFARAARLGAITELQAGGGVLFCGAYQQYERNWSESAADTRHACAPLRPCLHLLAQVVSVATPGRVVADAGFKTSVPVPFPLVPGGSVPRCVAPEGLEVKDVNAEHLILQPTPGTPPPPLAPGARLLLVPCYSDATTMLHRSLFGVRVRGGAARLDPAEMVVESEFDLRPSMGALF